MTANTPGATMTRRDFTLIATVLAVELSKSRSATRYYFREYEAGRIGAATYTDNYMRAAAAQSTILAVADNFATVLAGTNPRFDRERFLAHVTQPIRALPTSVIE